MKQGQFTDVLFSTNTSENFNFSIGFKGMRSLGTIKIYYRVLNNLYFPQIINQKTIIIELELIMLVKI